VVDEIAVAGEGMDRGVEWSKVGLEEGSEGRVTITLLRGDLEVSSPYDAAG
jgi:hypothetical protein